MSLAATCARTVSHDIVGGAQLPHEHDECRDGDQMEGIPPLFDKAGDEWPMLLSPHFFPTDFPRNWR